MLLNLSALVTNQSVLTCEACGRYCTDGHFAKTGIELGVKTCTVSEAYSTAMLAPIGKHLPLRPCLRLLQPSVTWIKYATTVKLFHVAPFVCGLGWEASPCRTIRLWSPGSHRDLRCHVHLHGKRLLVWPGNTEFMGSCTAWAFKLGNSSKLAHASTVVASGAAPLSLSDQLQTSASRRETG